MKGKGLAFDHGGRQIEVEEAAPEVPPMSRSVVRFPSAPPPALQQTNSPSLVSQEWRVSGGPGRRARHIRGRETRQYPNFPRNPPTVSEGGFSDPSFAGVVTGFAPVYRPNPSSLR